MVTQSAFGISVRVPLPYPLAVERARAALALEGFGIISEIDMAAVLRKKLSVDFRPYIILGACNHQLAHRALSADIEIGLLLPCNVIVYATDHPDVSVVAAMDPVVALQLSPGKEIEHLAQDARARLERALTAITR